MKSKFVRKAHFFGCLLLGVMLLVSCAPSLPAGQIQGKLVANGEPLSEQLVYIAIAPEEGAESAWVKLNDTTTDVEGNFLYENMKPGKYLLMVGNPGQFGAMFEYVIKDGERYTFVLHDGKGVDIGEVDASITRGNP